MLGEHSRSDIQVSGPRFTSQSRAVFLMIALGGAGFRTIRAGGQGLIYSVGILVIIHLRIMHDYSNR